MNEVVVDRGPSPYLCNLDLYIEHKYITSVQGDGKLGRVGAMLLKHSWKTQTSKFMYSFLRCMINVTVVV